MIRQRQLLIRHRPRIALQAVFAVLSCALAAGHSGLGHTEDGGEHMGTVVVSMCLAVLTVASTVSAFAAARLRRPEAASSRLGFAVAGGGAEASGTAAA